MFRRLIFKLKHKGKCKFHTLLFDIEMSNNTHILIKQCSCGKVKKDRVHARSQYHKLIKLAKEFEQTKKKHKQ